MCPRVFLSVRHLKSSLVPRLAYHSVKSWNLTADERLREVRKHLESKPFFRLSMVYVLTGLLDITFIVILLLFELALAEFVVLSLAQARGDVRVGAEFAELEVLLLACAVLVGVLTEKNK